MGGRQEEQSQQGADQDEEPVQPRGMARIETAEEVGGHGSLQKYHLQSQAWDRPMGSP